MTAPTNIAHRQRLRGRVRDLRRLARQQRLLLRLRQRRDQQRRRRRRHHGGHLLRHGDHLGPRLGQRPVDHGRHGERPVLRVNAGLNSRRPDHQLPVHHRDDRGRREPVGDPRRQRALRHAVHRLQRGAALGLQPDEEAGRDHPRHRRRQQRQLRGHLLRGRDDHRLPVATHRGLRAGQHRLRRLRELHPAEQPVHLGAQISLKATTPCCTSDYLTGNTRAATR